MRELRRHSAHVSEPLGPLTDEGQRASHQGGRDLHSRPLGRYAKAEQDKAGRRGLGPGRQGRTQRVTQNYSTGLALQGTDIFFLISNKLWRRLLTGRVTFRNCDLPPA